MVKKNIKKVIELCADMQTTFGGKQLIERFLIELDSNADYRTRNQFTTEDSNVILDAVEAIKVDNEFIVSKAAKEHAAEKIWEITKKYNAIAEKIEKDDLAKAKQRAAIFEDIFEYFEKNESVISKLKSEYTPINEKIRTFMIPDSEVKATLLRNRKRKEALDKTMGPFFMLIDFLAAPKN